jgi:shikimate kinase
MSESKSLAENIILIGIMGCGKSTVGRELQHRLGYPLVDMDDEIERMARKPITAIFADDGEDRFREMETQVLQELAAQDDRRRIISTGGGVIGREENRRLLRALGYVVWLDAPLAVILERTGKSRHRPLLHTDDPAAKIRELMERRAPLYQETAHLKLDTAGLDSGEIATGILECARYFFTHR